MYISWKHNCTNKLLVLDDERGLLDFIQVGPFSPLSGSGINNKEDEDSRSETCIITAEDEQYNNNNVDIRQVLDWAD